LASLLLATWLAGSDAFVGLPPSGPRNNWHLFGHNDGWGDRESPTPVVWSRACDDVEEQADRDLDLKANVGQASSAIRGGSTKSAPSHDIVKGSQITFSKMSNFWKSSFGNAFSNLKNVFKSEERKQQEEIVQQLRTMLVRAVSVPNSTVLPADVVRVAVKRSGLIGNPLRTDRVQEVARNLKRWYVRQGYILHSVTGATLKPETATAEITVEEPQISKVPVDITVCKEMVVDEGGELLTFRQYREKHAARKTFRHDRIEKKDLNTTFVPTQGRTKPSRIAKALLLTPGTPFRWDGNRWQKIATSGIFSQILRVNPVRVPDGTVCLQVYATEPPPRHLEYGLGKSLYTGSWEGEIDFEHQNLFGGGETVGLMVRRGTKESEPSVRLRYGDEHFGLEGGYDFEMFSDFIGDVEGSHNEDDAPTTHDYKHDSLLDRKGATFRLRNPINPKVIRNSVASTSLERTSTRTGLHESIGSATLALGPLRTNLPMGARSSISTSLTGGSRLRKKENSEDSTPFRVQLMPYSSVSATARQVLPLSPSQDGRNPLILALQHTVATSTLNLPRHEAKAMGVSAQIRGASPDGIASSTVKGTAEVRIHLNTPRLAESSVIFFGDWFCVQKDPNSSFYVKSSIGIGFRKIFQGLPLKYDICYSSDRKIKALFGLGPDFDI
jgi:outer membrane protein assembly factor BamA